MKLSAAYTVAAPRERVFTSITDPVVLQRCIDGCEKMVKTAEGNYDAHLKIGVAGLKGNYIGKVQLRDLKAPESYTLIMEGKGAPGFVKGTSAIALRADGVTTAVDVTGTVQTGGPIARLGQRLVGGVAKMMLDRFFACLQAKLTTF